MQLLCEDKKTLIDVATITKIYDALGENSEASYELHIVTNTFGEGVADRVYCTYKNEADVVNAHEYVRRLFINESKTFGIEDVNRYTPKGKAAPVTEREVKGVQVKTMQQDMFLAGSNYMEAGTTGYTGNDESRAYLLFHSESSIDFSVEVDKDKYESCTGVTLTANGDSSIEMLVETLRFAARALEEQIKKTGR